MPVEATDGERLVPGMIVIMAIALLSKMAHPAARRVHADEQQRHGPGRNDAAVSLIYGQR